MLQLCPLRVVINILLDILVFHYHSTRIAAGEGYHLVVCSHSKYLIECKGPLLALGTMVTLGEW